MAIAAAPRAAPAAALAASPGRLNRLVAVPAKTFAACAALLNRLFLGMLIVRVHDKLMPEQQEKNNDRQWNAEQPEQYPSTHDLTPFVCGSVCVNANGLCAFQSLAAALLVDDFGAPSGQRLSRCVCFGRRHRLSGSRSATRDEPHRAAPFSLITSESRASGRRPVLLDPSRYHNAPGLFPLADLADLRFCPNRRRSDCPTSLFDLALELFPVSFNSIPIHHTSPVSFDVQADVVATVSIHRHLPRSFAGVRNKTELQRLSVIT